MDSGIKHDTGVRGSSGEPFALREYRPHPENREPVVEGDVTGSGGYLMSGGRIQCRYCFRKGLKWQETTEGWRLFECSKLTGGPLKPHCCQEYLSRPRVFGDLNKIEIAVVVLATLTFLSLTIAKFIGVL